MKDIFQIRKELESNGWLWPPNYKEIEIKVWPQIETYFDQDETVLSALWASFDRFETAMIGMVFITDKRIFTLEIEDNGTNNNVRYVPIDTYKIDKIEFRKSKNSEELNLIDLKNDTYGNGVKFFTPNHKVAQHFLNTLAGFSNVEIVEIEAEKTELKQSEKVEKIKEGLEVKQIINFEPIQEQVEEPVIEERIIEMDLPDEKPETIQKEVKVKKERKQNSNQKHWLFVIPTIIIILVLIFVFAF